MQNVLHGSSSKSASKLNQFKININQSFFYHFIIILEHNEFNIIFISINYSLNLGSESPASLDKYLPVHVGHVLLDGLDDGPLGGMSMFVSM